MEQLLDAIRQIKAEGTVSAEQDKANGEYSSLALTRLDVQEVSEKALGRYWQERTAEEKKLFVELLSRLFVIEAFPNSSKFFASFKIVYGKTQDGVKSSVVPLSVIHENEGEIGIDFHLASKAGEWRVIDVDLDGVSMRNNLRAQFYKVIAKEGFAALVHRMEDKLKNTAAGSVR